MSPAHVLEPTYQAIKDRLMAGRWPAGYHLDTARIADDLGVSKSPVRDSLNHLAGERMVDFEAGAGFHVPRLDEKRFQDLLGLNLALLLAVTHTQLAIQPIVIPPEDVSARAARRFLQLAQASGNDELTAAIAGLNGRLSAVRLLESIVLSEPDVDLDALDEALAGRAHPRIVQEILTRYHVERARHAGGFVRLLSTGTFREADGNLVSD